MKKNLKDNYYLFLVFLIFFFIFYIYQVFINYLFIQFTIIIKKQHQI
jgi:hypothetical protein